MVNGEALDIGILITAALAVAGYIYRSGVEDRAAARNLLFYLLELRHELVFEQPKLEAFIDEFKSQMNEVIGDRPNLKFLVVDQIPQEHIAAMLASMNSELTRIDQPLLDSYEASLFTYSRVDPVLVHSIRGMKLLPIVSRNLTDVKTGYAEMMDSLEIGQDVADYGQNEVDSSLDDIFQQLMNGLDSKIRRVSRKAGFAVWFRVKRLLKRTEEEVERPDNTQFAAAEVIERLFKTLMINFGVTNEVKAQIEASSLKQIMDLFEAKLAESADQDGTGGGS
ncbi:hypothetical protein [Marinobacter salsuginis]|uniref:hypothetical protein n=1 Tax=Marinobacter salsuginis TaxID=418719 RepID=UPI00273FB945|nr:hypothetical protein [Marinobacter salsuginis]